MKRMFVLLAIAAVGMAASVTAAQAEVVTDETVSYAYSGFVPCANDGAGELVTGTIDAHNLITSTVNGSIDTWQFQFQPRGSVVGRSTGDTYRLTGVTRGIYSENIQSGEYALTYVNSYQLIGPGPANNLLVREVAHVTIDGDDVVVEHDDLSIECK
jgi:hypothetical protein